jgi:hypothetical protein
LDSYGVSLSTNPFKLTLTSPIFICIRLAPAL